VTVTVTKAERSAGPLSADDALVYDASFVPRYGGLFAQLIIDDVPQGTRGTVLDVSCATGATSFALLRRLAEGGRVIAVDREPALIDLARRRAAAGEDARRIFFKVESPETLSFGEEVFDVVVGNLVLGTVDATTMLAELRRVLVPEGRVLLTQTLSGSFEEAHDFLREIAAKNELQKLAERTDAAARRHPRPHDLAKLAESAGFHDVRLREEAIRLSFRSAREMFADPLLRFVGLPEWRGIVGPDAAGDRLLEQLERTFDTYFAGGALSLSVRAGLVSARRAG
jgi:ubiquinone/menaquinone biosynthesis C-methylase UbiE